MNSTSVQIALRELTVFVCSPRFWLTFIAVVVLFAVTGPYQTADEMNFPQRLGYWLVLHALTWTIAIVTLVVVGTVLMHHVRWLLARTLIAGFISPIPIGIVVALMSTKVSIVELTPKDFAIAILTSLPLTLVFSVLTFMTMGLKLEEVEAEGDLGDTSSQAQDQAQRPQQPAQHTLTEKVETPPLLARLKPENRGPLQHIAVEDHYVHVTTIRGRELVLLRFSDAIKEVGATEGLQVHRSHWVAKSFVETLKRDNGKLVLVLKDQQVIPVSRTHLDPVRIAFGHLL